MCHCRCVGVIISKVLSDHRGHSSPARHRFCRIYYHHHGSSILLSLTCAERTFETRVESDPSLHGGRRLPWITLLNTTCLPTSTPALLSTSPITAASTSTSPTPLLFAGNNIHMCPLSTTPPSTPRKFKTTTSTHPLCPQYPSNTHIVILPLTFLDIHKTIIRPSHHAPQLSS
ncbi:unnamed protein product [Brassica oleracea var. botrytis]|uniref:Uncharacterized protein n=1 Tax=Brassica oleracea TaxID=3712 RepID=A0A3P6B1K5_BRAOL|nr:unnamed protein product [Brassica oleracea]